LDSVTDWAARAERAGYRVGPLARDCGAKERELRRFFWRKFDMPPRAWLAKERLARGAALLRRGMFVKEAADEAGFKHAEDFSHCFTHQYGLPPSAFRAASDAWCI
jgi:AraC family transcriptional regulator